MKVRVIREHGNAYGDAYQKHIGDVYEIPGEQLVTLEGCVEPLAAAGKAKADVKDND